MRGKTTAAPWRDPWIVAALLAALALRLAMARGGLWLDEAWSSVMANDVGTPIGVLVNINHDNNHPLTSWWLQLIGIDAPPMLARALAIACSVATILPAAAFAARRSKGAGQAAAWLFALSPMLVLLGSEARGYAPALLAVVLLIERVDPLREQAPSRASFALIGLLGTLGHLLMLPAILLVGGWLAATRPCNVRSLLPALLASLAVVAIILGSAYAAQGGLTIGSSTPFSWHGFLGALVDLVRLTLGAAPLIVIAIIALVVRPRPSRVDAMLWLALGLGFPVAAALFQPANSHIGRYFILSTVPLLWLVAIRSAAMASGPRLLLLAPILIAMLARDAQLITSARAEPDQPVRRIAALHPGGASVLIGASRLSAVVEVAAARRGTKLVSVGPDCVAAPYLLVDLIDTAPPASLVHCQTNWSLLEHRLRPYRDGAGWALYRRAGLPATGAVASGPRPAL